MTFFRTNGLNFYYEVSGKGAPLLLLNGLSCDTRVMEPLADRLKGSFTLINYDMRCAGKSDKPDSPFTIAQVADETFRLIEHLGYGKISVLGFSMGGMVGMELFRSHKDIIDRLFLAASTASFKRPCPVSEEILSMLRRTDISPALLKQVYETMYGSRYRKAHPLEEYIRLREEDPNPQPAHAYLRQLDACESFDAVNHVCSIDVPVIIVAGNEDRLIPASSTEWLNKNIAGSKLHVLKNVGHVLPLEAPDKLAELIKWTE